MSFRAQEGIKVVQGGLTGPEVFVKCHIILMVKLDKGALKEVRDPGRS